ncbi:hypothetical protein A0256_23100 [Mucilaginibacter sp. PAMC 26640]|nr:hypothetical protein A0256_23100 [Mucilaginibacter sp. PAMC 26640]
MTTPGVLDYWYGPFASKDSAVAIIPYALRHTRTIGVITNGVVEEFFWPDINDLTATGLAATSKTSSLNTNLSGLRSMASIKADAIYQTIDYGGGQWYYDPSDTTSADNSGTIIVSGTKRFKRIFDNTQVFAEWFGAVGNGTTDDTAAIQAAINYSSGNKITRVMFKAANYLISHIDLKRNVSLIGAALYPSNTANIDIATRFVASTSGLVMVGYPRDGTYPTQNGEETLLAKSNPNLTIKNIVFDGVYKALTTLEIKESWGFKIDNCRFLNAVQYSLSLFDNNNFDISNCMINDYLSISNADYNFLNNEVLGNRLLPAYTAVQQSNGVNTNNKIYLSPYQGSYYSNFPISAVDAGGLFTTIAPNVLTGNPGWTFNTGTGSFTYNKSTNVLNVTAANTPDYKIVTDLPSLNVGDSYTITGTIYMDPSSVNASRILSFIPGNESQSYGTSTATNGNTVNINVTFTYNPSNPSLTNPVKLKFIAAASSGNDVFVISNLKMVNNSIGTGMNKLPVTISIDPAASTNIRNAFTSSEAYYIKWVSNTTFRLASSYYNYTNNIWSVPLAATTGVSNVFVQSPQSVLALIGRNSYNNTFSSNKFEDIYNIGVQLRGAYQNVFTGNTITKGSVSTGLIVGLSLEYGSSYNTFSGAITNRYQTTTIDKIGVSINIDKYSGHNVFSGLSSWGAKQIDVYDDYVGTSDNQNIYSNIGDNTYIWRQRSLDYSLNNRRGYIFAAGASSVSHTVPIILDKDFTLNFNDLYFDNSNADITLFDQTDASQTDAGRLSIKRLSSTTGIVIYVGGSAVFTSASGALANLTPYDITVTRDMAYVWSVYINGVKLTPNSSASPNTDIASGGTIKPYIGGLSNTISTYSIKRFRYFNDVLGDSEIRSLFSGSFLDKNCFKVTNPLNSITSGVGVIASAVAATVAAGANGYNGGASIDVSVTGSTNLIILNVANADNSLINKSLRLSFYAKSASIGIINITRNGITHFIPITSGYNKYCVLLKPDMNASLKSTEAISMSFANEVTGSFGSSVTPATSGTINFDDIKVFTGLTPVVVDLDLTNRDGVTYTNTAGTTFAAWTIPDIIVNAGVSQFTQSAGGANSTGAAFQFGRNGSGIGVLHAVYSSGLTSSNAVQTASSINVNAAQSGSAGLIGHAIDITETTKGSGIYDILRYRVNNNVMFEGDDIGNFTAAGALISKAQKLGLRSISAVATTINPLSDYTINISSGTFTQPLPAAPVNTVFVIKNSGAGTITLSATSIDGTTTLVLSGKAPVRLQAIDASGNYIII